MADQTDIIAVTVKVRGRVQGVAYRASCAAQAQRLGLRGWVRNEPDGSVAAHVEGDPSAVNDLVTWCRSGPSYAAVRDVTTLPAPVGSFTRFEIRY